MKDTTPSPDDRCAICLGPLVTKKLKRFCERCGQLCETCCDGGCDLLRQETSP